MDAAADAYVFPNDRGERLTTVTISGPNQRTGLKGCRIDDLGGSFGDWLQR